MHRNKKIHSLNKQASTAQRHANAKPMKAKKKKRKRKYYERITMQAERTHTKQRKGDTGWKMKKRMQYKKVRKKGIRNGINKE